MWATLTNWMKPVSIPLNCWHCPWTCRCPQYEPTATVPTLRAPSHTIQILQVQLTTTAIPLPSAMILNRHFPGWGNWSLRKLNGPTLETITKLRYGTYCEDFQPCIEIWQFGRIKTCLIQVAITDHTDCPFKLQNWGWDPKIVVLSLTPEGPDSFYKVDLLSTTTTTVFHLHTTTLTVEERIPPQWCYWCNQWSGDKWTMNFSGKFAYEIGLLWIRT